MMEKLKQGWGCDVPVVTQAVLGQRDDPASVCYLVLRCCKQSSAAGIAYHAQEKPPRVHLIQKGFQDPQRLTDVLLPVLACLLERRFLRCLHIHMAVV